jgi:hypothetical protein
MEDQGHQAMWPQMIAALDALDQAMWPQMIAALDATLDALDAIDEALGLPANGCNSTGQTLVEIKRLQGRVEHLIHERNVLQKISARRASALERVGLHADCTMEEAEARRDGLWPPLAQTARVGNGTFNAGVSSRLVIEAAQRQHTYAEEEGRLTGEQARQHEKNRRKLWDMVNGPLANCDHRDTEAPMQMLAILIAVALVALCAGLALWLRA